MRALTDKRGDLRALEGDLAGFYRLRVGRYRVVFHYQTVRQLCCLRCEYAEERPLIYQVVADLVRHWQS